MYELFNILERYGIIGVPDIAKIASLPAKNIETLHHDVYTNIFDAQNDRIWGKSTPPTDTFSFHASASLRGDSGCSAVLCHLNKLDFLARYAALYASELTFPLTMVRPKPDQSIPVVRDWLEHDLLSLLFLRPLITGKVVFPVVMRSQHCIHEAEWMEESTELVHDFSQAVAKDLHSEFKLMYQRPDKSPSGRPTFYLEGPEQYIEHGGLAGLLDHIPEWLPKTGRYDKEGRIEVRGPYKKVMVAGLFTDIADNITFYLAYGIKRKARFLSDMRGETDFLDWLNGDDEQMTAKTRALRELQHCVPILAELPIATILRIRKEEKEAFQSYRDTVAAMSANILAADKRVSKKQAREMFRDAIEPELRKMKKGIRTYQKVSLKKSVAGFASLFAGVLIGAYAGLPPLVSVPLTAAGTIVGGNLLMKAADAACEHGPELKQKNDLYFLLRLTEEAQT